MLSTPGNPVLPSQDGEAHGASLVLREVTKSYDSSVVVNRVSLDIAAGEFMTFLGPSGSGKTTTLNMIAGFTDVSEGHILIGTQPIEDRPPYKRDIGMVFQNYALFPHMTVADNIAFPLKRRRVAKASVANRVADALAMVRLDGFGGRYPNQLSGGQQQRVALARAIVFRPRVLLMDEPLGALDKKLREWLQLEIKRIHNELGITFVYVTHDQEEALVMSDRIALFNGGRIEQLGTAEELYLRPETKFAAEFLGESNVFEGRLAAEGRNEAETSDGLSLHFGQTVDDVDSSSPVCVVVRPERMRIIAPHDLADNSMTGLVTQVIYLGLARRLEVTLPTGRCLIVREQAGAFSDVREGDSVRVGWSAVDTRAVRNV